MLEILGLFYNVWYKSYVTTFCNNYTLRGIFLQVLTTPPGLGSTTQRFARKSSPFRQKSVGINAAKIGGDEWIRMVQLQQKWVVFVCVRGWSSVDFFKTVLMAAGTTVRPREKVGIIQGKERKAKNNVSSYILGTLNNLGRLFQLDDGPNLYMGNGF